jgi:hypothetical protein
VFSERRLWQSSELPMPPIGFYSDHPLARDSAIGRLFLLGQPDNIECSSKLFGRRALGDPFELQALFDA